jgi:hypothetical protein
LLSSGAAFAGAFSHELLRSGARTVETDVSPTQEQHAMCSHCKSSCGELGITYARQRKGDLKTHEYLCQGIGRDGRPLGIPRTCLVPGCHDKDKTVTAWKMHYFRQHNISLSDNCNLQHLRERYQLWLLPDFEMNAYWGCFASKKNPLMEEQAQQYAHHATSDPFTFEVERKWELLNVYRDNFQ